MMKLTLLLCMCSWRTRSMKEYPHKLLIDALPCHQWLRQHNCPWNIQECLMYSGHDTEDNDEEITNWILQFIN